jgi:hypothetical protein
MLFETSTIILIQNSILAPAAAIHIPDPVPVDETEAILDADD